MGQVLLRGERVKCGPYTAGLGILVLATCVAGAARAELPRFHGDYLDGRHVLLVREFEGCATVLIRADTRAPGGPDIYVNTDTEEEVPVIRVEKERELVRICSDVLVPSEPNYIKNPGKRYRITFEGIEVAPEYNRVFEVNAADALDAVFNEFSKVYRRATGIQKDALYFGGILAARALNEAGHLPARIPASVLRSDVFNARLKGQYFERVEQPRQQRFTDVESASGQEALTVFQEEKEFSRLESQAADDGGRDQRPGSGEAGRQKPFLASKFRFDEAERRPEHRANQVRDRNDPERAQEQLGLRIRPLTAPPHGSPTDNRARELMRESQTTTMEMLKGPVQSTAEARLQALDKQDER